MLAALALLSISAWAAGDLSESDEENVRVYFGFVRDNRGSAVPDVRISASLNERITFVQRTDAAGLYRFRNSFNQQVNPNEVIISCEKEGYKQTRVTRRPVPKASTSPVQIDCVLERN
jgi:hypothetical protein